MDKNTNYMTGYVRALPKEGRTVTFVASTSTVDRHKTVLNQDNWQIENFNNNPVIGYQHDLYGGDMCNKADPDDVIGRGSARVEEIQVKDSEQKEKQLLVGITFEEKDVNEKADKIFKKIQAGTLNSVSVGFIPIGEGRKGKLVEEDGKQKTINEDVFYFDGQELLEISVVNIPANPEANRRSMKDQTTKALHVVKRLLGKSYTEIEKMTVGDVMAEIEGRDIKDMQEPPPEEITVKINSKTLADALKEAEKAIRDNPLFEEKEDEEKNKLKKLQLIKKKKLFLYQYSN